MSMKENWDTWASESPYFAVITDPEYKNGVNDNFWRSGFHCAAGIEKELNNVGVKLSDCTVAELGVGVGRVGSHVSKLCKEYTGIDVSPKMMEVCKKHHPHLRLQEVTCDFPEVDVFYSIITLQHCKHEDIRVLIKRMLAASRRATIFQLPDIPSTVKMGECEPPYIHMYGLPVGEVISLAQETGFKPYSIRKEYSAGPKYDSYTYVFMPENRIDT